VVDEPDALSARISATAATGRYPVNDGTEATIQVSVTAACQTSCTDADPQAIATFVGTLLHSYEIELLTIQLDAPFQIEFDCGYGAQACYYPGQNKIILSGNDTPAADGASREMVLAHEYGHHVAQHRDSPAPFPAAIEWGPPRWSSYENVCRLRRAGAVFPGDAGEHYYQDPGEAFAESFARYHFPEAPVPWKWLPALRPDAGAFQAIREDTLDPWLGRTSFVISGRAPPRDAGATIRTFRTPIDGRVSLRPARRPKHRYRLSLRNPAGRELRTPGGRLGTRRKLNFTVCGQNRLRVVLRSTRDSDSPFRLQVQRP
jgi:hypothetical protein